MKKYVFPKRDNWAKLVERPVMEVAALDAKVSAVLQQVKKRGDEAVREYTTKFDGVELADFQVTSQEFAEAQAQVSDELKEAIQIAKANIETFHAAQKTESQIVETMSGVRCWRKSVAIERVGLYIPGGTAPLFSTILMLGVPAKLAGCKEIVLCTPPGKAGKVHPAILHTAQAVGITKVFKIGGAQAVAAMAYGTETVPSVYKIFGPGNQYVTAAKQLVSREGVAIDMPAGPSEVLVCADASANPAFVAADLLSQAEHGIDSQVVLVAFAENFVDAVQQEMDKQLTALPRKEIAEQALANSVAIVVKDKAEAQDLINAYAAEHLILALDEAENFSESIVNAGSVFLGHYTPESVGDYASGTNHTLPTNGFARAYSGVSLDSFVKKITYQRLTKGGLKQLGNAVAIMAAAEQLEAHKRAVTIRLDD